jgi:SAM-dependent methyltransferase
MAECPVCQSLEVNTFFNLKSMPTSIGILWESKESAQSCPTGEMDIAYCQQCGLVFNASFNEEKLTYDQQYNNSLHYSSVYQDYAESTASKLIEKYGLRGKEIIEIGCGKGDFLILLCRLGENSGIGFDKSYEERDLTGVTEGQVTFVNDLYTPEQAAHQGDMVCSRYVLEHIERPVDFLKSLRGMVDENRNPVFYFEVPNAALIFDKLSVWDLIYEHCLYFSKSSLRYAFETSGFSTIDVYDAFDGQFVAIEARVNSSMQINDTKPDHLEVAKLSEQIDRFSENFEQILQVWRGYLDSAANGRCAVLWGAGAKGVSFLNLLEVGEAIRAVVDINPAKSGRFIAGTGHEIISPEKLKTLKPDSVLLLNPVYKQEVSEMLKDMGLFPEIVCFE